MNLTAFRKLAQARVCENLALSPQGVPSCCKTLVQSLTFSGFEFLLDSGRLYKHGAKGR